VPDAVEVPASVPLVVTEGNYLLHDALGWSAARRDAATAWVRDVDLVNAALVAGGRHRADVVVRLSRRS